MRYALLLAVLLLSSCSGQPAPKLAEPLGGSNVNSVPQAKNGEVVTETACTQPNGCLESTLSVLIGPILPVTRIWPDGSKALSYYQFSGRDYVEGSTKQWLIRTLPWPCEQPATPNVHVIVTAEQQPDKTWVATKCIGDHYNDPYTYICPAGIIC